MLQDNHGQTTVHSAKTKIRLHISKSCQFTTRSFIAHSIKMKEIDFSYHKLKHMANRHSETRVCLRSVSCFDVRWTPVAAL